MWIGVLWAGLRVAMWITHVGGKFHHGLLEKSLKNTTISIAIVFLERKGPLGRHGNTKKKGVLHGIARCLVGGLALHRKGGIRALSTVIYTGISVRYPILQNVISQLTCAIPHKLIPRLCRVDLGDVLFNFGVANLGDCPRMSQRILRQICRSRSPVNFSALFLQPFMYSSNPRIFENISFTPISCLRGDHHKKNKHEQASWHNHHKHRAISI